MKTIQERAALNLRYERDFLGNDLSENMVRRAYIRGATEQRKIDIIRVRQFLEREAAYNGTMSCVDDLLIEELYKVIEEE